MKFWQALTWVEPEQLIETAKFAVAMAADGANVTEGYEVYDVKPDGSIVYGLTAP
jgi:hypothetical protein